MCFLLDWTSVLSIVLSFTDTNKIPNLLKRVLSSCSQRLSFYDSKVTNPILYTYLYLHDDCFLLVFCYGRMANFQNFNYFIVPKRSLSRGKNSLYFILSSFLGKRLRVAAVCLNFHSTFYFYQPTTQVK